MPNSTIRCYEIFICDSCVNLRGEMCDTPGCCLCWRSTAQIRDFLKQALILVDNGSGQLINLQSDIAEAE